MADSNDVTNAETFQQLARIRQPGLLVSLRLAPGGGHTMATWRTLTRPMLAWMTPRLAAEAARSGSRTGTRGPRVANHG